MKGFFTQHRAKPFLFAAVLVFVFVFSASFRSDSQNGEQFPSHLAGIDADAVDWGKKDTGYWRAVLNKKRLRICREKGTEFPGTGRYNDFYDEGIYRCSSCGLELFSSKHKYDSHTGWPSFWQPVSDDAVAYKNDRSFGMFRTEIVCGRCGAHLGHIFNDGPKPTGKRYCVNSICLFHEKPKRRF